MTVIYGNALGLLADVLDPEFPEAAAFLKSSKGTDTLCVTMQVNNRYGCGLYDDAYHAVVDTLWGDEAAFGEAGDFLNSRIVRNAYYDRVREEVRKLDHEAEQAERKAAERRTRLKEKLDRLTRDGILTKDEREELEHDDPIPF